MRGPHLLLMAVLVWSCGAQLPSSEPLGEGPLAKAEAVARAKAEAEAEANADADAGGDEARKTAGGAKSKAESSAREPSALGEPGMDAGAVAADAASGVAETDAGAPPASSIAYAGEYVGSDVSTFKIGGMDREEKDDKARTRVEVTRPGELALTFIDSSNGKDICTLKASVTGKTATLAPGQKCWGADGGTMSGTLTRGTATFQDKRLLIDSDFDLEVGSGEFRMSGTLVYHFDGTRK